MPFDRSGADLTAHALRALQAWRHTLAAAQYDRAVRHGFDYLQRTQKEDGWWSPLWFGNQDFAAEENPVYGTCKVLTAYLQHQRHTDPEVDRGLAWLVDAQNPDGGWGGGAAVAAVHGPPRSSTVEETALAVETLARAGRDGPSASEALANGTAWLVSAVEDGRYRECSPIGFYFAKLWYYEKLYPITFTVSALGQAIRHQFFQPGDTTRPAHLTC
jgi:squalene-hopene/tetraprenyl-beta-curcumene cyclase